MTTITIQGSCGHSMEREVKYSEKSTEKYWSAKECTACWKSEQDTLKEAVGEKYLMPELQGSEKQVSWATQLRATKVLELESFISDLITQLIDGSDFDHDSKEVVLTQESLNAKLGYLVRVLQAKFWIDTRGYAPGYLLSAVRDGKVVLEWRAQPTTIKSHGRYIKVGGTKVHTTEMELAV